ncbi:Uncharacterised protein [BD1-7 clade bacterium]|uniref:Uncharacterized protein n=1 Tax=BD1-7 clade bacterium TaxID=2029982 RepID=A0A5S9NPP9_9GAMM|nr:Uncharacterised protein [BD1-7 clade bacterium]
MFNIVERLFNKNRMNVEFILAYQFPDTVRNEVASAYPSLTEQDLDHVESGLREFFLVCAENRLRWCTMPSKVVDEAWHGFILDTHQYQQFCQNAFGQFLHHTPSQAMKNPKKAQEGVRRSWIAACKIEDINPKLGIKIPLLYSLDKALNIPDGYYYVPNCEMPAYADVPNYYCAGHITNLDSAGGGCAGGGCGGGGCGC